MALGNQPPKYLTLILSSMILDRGQYRVATFLDETDHRTLARVEQENQLLQMLQSSVTHELLTPLKCIISFAKTLERDLIHSNNRKEVQMIELTAKLISSQVQMLLDNNMIDHDKFELDLQDCPINRVVSDVIAIMNEMAAPKRIEIVFKPLPTELILKMDLVRTQQIIINLLSNAIKFSPESSKVVVAIKCLMYHKLKLFKTFVSVQD